MYVQDLRSLLYNNSKYSLLSCSKWLCIVIVEWGCLKNIYHYLKSGEKVLHLSKLYGKLFAQKSSSRINHYAKHKVVHSQNIGCAIFVWEDAPLINLEDERVGREIKMRKPEKFLWPVAFLYIIWCLLTQNEEEENEAYKEINWEKRKRVLATTMLAATKAWS